MKNTNPNAKHNNPFKQACWFSSPSHAWLAVPRELLKKHKLEEKISSFSYQQTHQDGTPIVFLEEDCDATLLINTLGKEKYVIAYSNGWINTVDVNNKFFEWVTSYKQSL